MKYFIIGLCILLIVLAFYIVIRQIIRSVKGKSSCGGNCQGCQYSSSCRQNKTDSQD